MKKEAPRGSCSSREEIEVHAANALPAWTEAPLSFDQHECSWLFPEWDNDTARYEGVASLQLAFPAASYRFPSKEILMAYKSILLHLDIDGDVAPVIKLAIDVAKRFDARL